MRPEKPQAHPLEHEPPLDIYANEIDGDIPAFFSESDLRMTPEEYAARHAHLFACFSFHRFRYRDTALGAWMRRLGEILFDEVEVERCRQRYLTPGELAEVRRSEAEGF